MASQSQTIDKSIIEYMTENQNKREHVKRIYDDWKELLDALGINVSIRQKFDGWFIRCYIERNSGRNQELFAEFLKGESMIDDFLLKQEICEIKRSRDLEWVERAIDCVTQERELIHRHIEAQKNSKNKEHYDRLDAEVVKAKDLHKDIQLKLSQMEKVLDSLRTKGEEKDEAEQLLCGLNEVMNKRKPKEGNGKILNKHHLESTIGTASSAIHKLKLEQGECKQALCTKFVEIFNHLQQLVPKLELEVQKWKYQYKMKFAELAAELELHNVDRIDSWCSDIGLILYDLERVRLAKWQELCNDLYTQQELDIYTKIMQIIAPLCFGFITRTFIVVDQDDFIVKTDKKHLPKIKIRVMALNKVEVTGVTVSAFFAREEDISECWDPRNSQFNFKKLEECSFKMNQHQLIVEKKKKSKEKFEVIFDKLAFKEQFARTATDRKPFVHEEKYRVVFSTVIENRLVMSTELWTYRHLHEWKVLPMKEPSKIYILGLDCQTDQLCGMFELWKKTRIISSVCRLWQDRTMSLPMVVTTGANQGCCALASVMWQCYSTDVYAIPIQCRPSLPWSDIAEMLQAKMSKLSAKRRLTDQNIKHLKRRLLGSEHKPDDTDVTLNKFCFDKMNKPDDENEQFPFSFWRWFLANYNLLDKYLKQYWEDGLIAGFLSKDDVEQMFRAERIHRQGVFVLRFSDNHINDSQGTNSMFGYITGMVSSGYIEEDGEKKCKVVSTEVADHKKLKDKNLANILRESQSKSGNQIYRNLFPGNRSRADYFDKYCKEGTVVNGYKGPQDAFIVDLEQDMCALKISTGKHCRRASFDSGIDPMSPASTGGGSKRVKSSTETHPTVASLLSQPGSNIGSPGQQSYISTPQASPAYSMSSPHPAISPAPSQTMYDPVSPAGSSSIQSQLPVMVQNGFNEVDGRQNNGHQNNSQQNGFTTISQSDYGTISTNGQHFVTAGNEHLIITDQNNCFMSSPSHTEGPEVLIIESTDVVSDGYNSNSAFDLPNCRFNTGGQMNNDSPIVNQSPFISGQCQESSQLQQLLSNMSRDPQQFNQILSVVLSQLPSDQIQNLHRMFSSTQSSPIHQMVETDNTPMDFVGQQTSGEIFLSSTQSSPANQMVETDNTPMDFVGQQTSDNTPMDFVGQQTSREIFLSNDEIESGRNVNSGNIEVDLLLQYQDDPGN